MTVHRWHRLSSRDFPAPPGAAAVLPVGAIEQQATAEAGRVIVETASRRLGRLIDEMAAYEPDWMPT